MKGNNREVSAGKRRWEKEVSPRLPALLDQLLAAPDCADRPPQTHGVYLFSENGEAMYVGRTGRTERSLRAGKKGHSNFATRRRGHTQARHNAGTYAYKLALANMPMSGTRAANCTDEAFVQEFRRQCARVGAMEFRVVEISDDKLAAVFEVYAATVLGTPNSWATS